MAGTRTTLKNASNKMQQTMTGLVCMRSKTKGINTMRRETLYHTGATDERLHAVEGGNRYWLEVVDLCLIPDVGLSVDFKTPKFDKYKGSTCPQIHLAMYCCKMAAYIYDDKVLIHCFQDSLTGTALSWYVRLEQGCIKTWRDLTEAFLKQYKYNQDVASNRS
ncbi:hypothetical protein CR513_10639, partial [Mucuna pruriens]